MPKTPLAAPPSHTERGDNSPCPPLPSHWMTAMNHSLNSRNPASQKSLWRLPSCAWRGSAHGASFHCFVLTKPSCIWSLWAYGAQSTGTNAPSPGARELYALAQSLTPTPQISRTPRIAPSPQATTRLAGFALLPGVCFLQSLFLFRVPGLLPVRIRRSSLAPQPAGLSWHPRPKILDVTGEFLLTPCDGGQETGGGVVEGCG